VNAREVVKDARRCGFTADITRFPATCEYALPHASLPCGEDALVVFEGTAYCTPHAEQVFLVAAAATASERFTGDELEAYAAALRGTAATARQGGMS
jgi:hypothetical protein